MLYNYGNILSKNGKAYTYGGDVWKDLLTAYDGQGIEYDAQGNPTSYLGHTLTWEKGRQLKSFDGNTYTYNANGIRTSKTVDGVLHTYTLDGTKILKETWGENVLVPLYDNEDGVCGIVYNATPYYFVKNLQGDVIAIVDKTAQTVARYSYDAWGVPTVTLDISDCRIASINPYSYRSYYYDAEIAKYYLQSRYYDAQTGRFVNGDDLLYLQLGERSNSLSVFTYCYNNSVNMEDDFGNLPNIIIRYLNTVKGYISSKAFKLVTMSNWLGVIGGASRLAMTIKAIFNFQNNRKKEGKLSFKDGYIDDQHKIQGWYLGYQDLKKCGCEVISVYNALKACGKPYKLCELILYFELCGYVMLYGYLGSNPIKLWMTFASLNIKHESSFTLSVAERKIKKATCGIVSCWNEKITKGLHTFMVEYDKEKELFKAYNGYKGDKDKKPFSESKFLTDVLYPKQFIIGYSIK